MPDGPGGFQRDFACPAVLRILLGINHISNTRLSLSLADLPISFFYIVYVRHAVLQPLNACIKVWAPPVSLAATQGIDFSFSSCRYLDVSVLCVYLILRCDSPLQLPGSPIRTSLDLSSLTAPQRISSFVTSFFGS